MGNQKKIPKFAMVIQYLMALFLIVGCSVEHDLLEHENSKAIIHKRLTLEDLKTKKGIMKKLSDYSKEMNKITARNRNAEPLIVDISQANFIETDDFISYTFNMPTDSVPIRNFLLKQNKNDDLGYQGYVLDYNLTEEEVDLFNNNQLRDLTGKISTIKLNGNYNLGQFGRSIRTSGTCYGWVGICYVGDPDGHAAYGSECTVSGQVFAAFPCPEDAGGGGGGGLPPITPEPPNNPTPPTTPPITGSGGREIVVTPVPTNPNPITPIDLNEIPCPGDPVKNPEICPTASGNLNGGTFGCTRFDKKKTCDNIPGKKKHNGLDIKGEVFDKIYNMYGGKVTKIVRNVSKLIAVEGSLGNYIEIEFIRNGVSYKALYAHLWDTGNFFIGQNIQQGTEIGTLGKTGNANRKKIIPHLHLEVKMKFGNTWTKIDPKVLLYTQYDNNNQPILNNCN